MLKQYHGKSIGQGLVEYGVILAVLVTVAIAAVNSGDVLATVGNLAKDTVNGNGEGSVTVPSYGDPAELAAITGSGANTGGSYGNNGQCGNGGHIIETAGSQGGGVCVPPSGGSTGNDWPSSPGQCAANETWDEEEMACVPN